MAYTNTLSKQQEISRRRAEATSECGGCQKGEPCPDCLEDEMIQREISLAGTPSAPVQREAAEPVTGMMLDHDTGGVVDFNENTMPSNEPINREGATPTNLDTNPLTQLDQNPPQNWTPSKAETAYAEFNFGGGKSPEEVAADQQQQKFIIYGVAVIIVIILILIMIKMFKK